MRDTSGPGERAEAEVLRALVLSGASIWLPWGGSSRADLVFEDDEGLHRVQVKRGRVTRGALFFATCSNTGGMQRDYRGEVEYFGVYSPELDRCFLVPVGHVPSRGAHLRLEPTRNNQHRGIRWAVEYLLPGVLENRSEVRVEPRGIEPLASTVPR